MRIFIAGASGDRALVAALLAQLSAHGCSGYDWTSNPGYQDESQNNPLQNAYSSYTELQQADALILLVTEKPSPGATGEAMLAHLSGIPVVVLVCVPGHPDLSPGHKLRDSIPVENIWAHWLSAQHPTVSSFRSALRELGVIFPGRATHHQVGADGTKTLAEEEDLSHLGPRRSAPPLSQRRRSLPALRKQVQR